jgi:methylenetetrahydrofolate dehydrogenase (NADP+)/methenyltetrahydrofolate cyclohydrolase
LHAVIVGRSQIVGLPIAHLLLAENCTVTVAHSKTKDLPALCQTADILVVAIGKPEFITKAYLKKDAIVIDVGINRTPQGLKGDVLFTDACEVASYVTPVPKGVGPMTIAMLLENTVEAYLKQQHS